MRKYKLPFREGHHFASEVVSYAKANDIKPLDFPYSEAPKIYAKTVKEKQYQTELPMSEEEFRSTLDPVAIVKNRATVGGPQPAGMQRMLKAANERLDEQAGWIDQKRKHIDDALADLDRHFNGLLAKK